MAWVECPPWPPENSLVLVLIVQESKQNDGDLDWLKENSVLQEESERESCHRAVNPGQIHRKRSKQIGRRFRAARAGLAPLEREGCTRHLSSLP